MHDFVRNKFTKDTQNKGRSKIKEKNKKGVIMEKKNDKNKIDRGLKENWKHWEEEMGEVYLENGCSHICSATDCTGLIPAGHTEQEIYERYEALYPYQPNKDMVDDSV